MAKFNPQAFYCLDVDEGDNYCNDNYDMRGTQTILYTQSLQHDNLLFLTRSCRCTSRRLNIFIAVFRSLVISITPFNATLAAAGASYRHQEALEHLQKREDF